MNVKKFVGIFLKRLRSRVMSRNTSERANMLIYRFTCGQLSPLEAQQNVRGYPGIVNDVQPCPKQCLLILLARFGARTDNTTRAATTQGARRGQFPRTRIGVQSAPRVCFSFILGTVAVNCNMWTTAPQELYIRLCHSGQWE